MFFYGEKRSFMSADLLEDNIQSTPLIISASVVSVIIVLIALLSNTAKKSFDSKCIAFAGISIALSVGLSFIKLFALPQGGSVTLASILPLLLFSYIYGTRKGVLVGVIFGLISFAIDPFAVHPAQVILDYVVAYSAMGLSGIFDVIPVLKKMPRLSFVLGSTVACVLRFASHVLSGVFAFSTFATTEIWIYSIAYNSFVFVDLAIAVVVGVVLLSSKSLVNAITKE